MRIRDLWRTGQRGWPASYPIAQFPNPPLLLAIAAWLVAAVTDGDLHDIARGAFLALLAAWAWEELSAGDNLFRRGLGLVVLVSVVRQIADA